jgi:hypothetical protein
MAINDGKAGGKFIDIPAATNRVFIGLNTLAFRTL